jgi:hypothetical protein
MRFVVADRSRWPSLPGSAGHPAGGLPAPGRPPEPPGLLPQARRTQADHTIRRRRAARATCRDEARHVPSGLRFLRESVQEAPGCSPSSTGPRVRSRPRVRRSLPRSGRRSTALSRSLAVGAPTLESATPQHRRTTPSTGLREDTLGRPGMPEPRSRCSSRECATDACPGTARFPGSDILAHPAGAQGPRSSSRVTGVPAPGPGRFTRPSPPRSRGDVPYRSASVFVIYDVKATAPIPPF